MAALPLMWSPPDSDLLLLHLLKKQKMEKKKILEARQGEGQLHLNKKKEEEEKEEEEEEEA